MKEGQEGEIVLYCKNEKDTGNLVNRSLKQGVEKRILLGRHLLLLQEDTKRPKGHMVSRRSKRHSHSRPGERVKALDNTENMKTGKYSSGGLTKKKKRKNLFSKRRNVFSDKTKRSYPRRQEGILKEGRKAFLKKTGRYSHSRQKGLAREGEKVFS